MNSLPTRLPSQADLKRDSSAGEGNGKGNTQPLPERVPMRRVDALVGAQRRAASKSFVEMPLLRLTDKAVRDMREGVTEAEWRAIASFHSAQVQLSDASIALMLTKQANAPLPMESDASPIASANDATQDMLRNFKASLALDTVRNEYLLHRQIHTWFMAGESVTDIDTLNDRIYADLFLTPESDPWLGLKDDRVYTALPNAGIASN